MASHTVKQGECFISIAAKYGYGGKWEDLYNHADNASLKEKRPDPFCLMPGDVISVPDDDGYSESVKIKKGKKHTFVIKRPKALVTLKLVDTQNEPLADAPYELHIDDEIIKGNTDADGLIEEEVSAEAEEAKVLFWPNPDFPERLKTYELEMGHLDPVEEISGKQGRLINQGFPLARVDNTAGDKTNSALAHLDFMRQLKDTDGNEQASVEDSLLRYEK